MQVNSATNISIQNDHTAESIKQFEQNQNILTFTKDLLVLFPTNVIIIC